MKYNNILKALFVSALFISTSTCSLAQISTDAKLQYNKGIDYYQLGQYEQAADSFRQAVDLDPNYIDAYFNLGSILEYLKQDDAALAVFKQIILRKPDDYEAVYKAAALSKKLGQDDKAKMYLSLIPADSMMGSQAKQLASTLNTDMQTLNEEVKVSNNTFTNSNPLNNSHGSYDDISSPTGVVTDNNGNLYVAGFSDNTIYRIDPNNNKIVYIKSEKIDGPIGLAMDSDRNIYIANYNKDNVLKYDRNGEITELITGVQKPYCLHITGDLLFVSSQGNNSVLRYKLR